MSGNEIAFSLLQAFIGNMGDFLTVNLFGTVSMRGTCWVPLLKGFKQIKHVDDSI